MALRQFLKWDAFVLQQQAKQLSAVKAFSLFVASVVGLRAITWLLMSSKVFYAWTRAHHDLYVAGFYALQLLMNAGLVMWLVRRYSAALFAPRPTSDWRVYLAVVAIALPFLLYEGSKVLRHSSAVISLATLKPENVEGMMSQVWGAMVGGYTIWHVAYATTAIFVVVALEEIVFTGLILNRLSRRLWLGVAMVACAMLFAAAHFFSIMTYVTENLPKLLWLSLTSQAIRLVSGRLELSIACHVVANMLVSTPKWVLAYIYFAGSR